MSQTNKSAPENYIKIGPVYIVNDAGKGQAFLSVTSQHETADKNTLHYYLQLNDIQNNSLLKRNEIAVTHNRPLEHEQVIGRLGDIIFILHDSLLGYNVHSLELAVTEANIVAVNPFMKDNFSRYANSYLLDEAAQVMYIGTENGDRYKLYLPALILKPDNSSSDPAPDNFNYEFAAGYKLNDRYQLKDALTCIDTLNNMLYILGSKTETGYVLSYFGTAIFPERNENRQVTIVPYHADGEKLDYKKNHPHTVEKYYYKAGFLQNKFFTMAWKNLKAERIIVYNGDDTNKATMHIALIDNNGKEKWATDTGISENNFTDYLLADKNLLLWFNIQNKEIDTQQTIVVNIDLDSGKFSSYNNVL